jgi:hypothetical protein
VNCTTGANHNSAEEAAAGFTHKTIPKILKALSTQEELWGFITALAEGLPMGHVEQVEAGILFRRLPLSRPGDPEEVEAPASPVTVQ